MVERRTGADAAFKQRVRQAVVIVQPGLVENPRVGGSIPPPGTI